MIDDQKITGKDLLETTLSTLLLLSLCYLTSAYSIAEIQKGLYWIIYQYAEYTGTSTTNASILELDANRYLFAILIYLIIPGTFVGYWLEMLFNYFVQKHSTENNS